MKRKLILLFLIISFLKLNNIYAESYKCVYNFEESENYKVTIEIDSTKKNNSILIEQVDCTFCWKYTSTDILDSALIYQLDFSEEEKQKLRDELNNNIYSGKCDTTLMIFRYWSDGSQQQYFSILFNDTLEASAKQFMDRNITTGTYVDLRNGWLIFSSEESTAEGIDIGYQCPYDSLYENFKNAYDNIKKCKGSCSNYYSEYNMLKKQMISYCRIQTKYLDYGKSCLNRCLKINDDIKEYSLNNFSEESQCGFSERLILWIANIIRWVKYIVPVAVIVLGILDFMKAISADKEDEMKKSQQRFIRRLIAAGLIFIAPFIIEFILNKMGFAANGCGIINL